MPPGRRLELHRRRAVVALLLLILLCLQLMLVAVRRHTIRSSPNAWWQAQDAAPPPSSNVTVNLVVASLRKDDISWTSKLRIPNLEVVRYISDFDEGTADFHHPPVPRKGREATIYHTYFHDFYDRLPDVSIMIHAHENPWHIEAILQQSMLFTLSHLDLEHVRRRGYANLRILWENACPFWLNTTKTPEESDKKEEPFMRAAFAANFDMSAAQVPELLGGTCCSQFAVSRDAVHRHPREQYARNRNWLVTTSWPDYISGRTWEHMFPWLFKGEASDCPGEWEAYCAMYHVCFDGQDEVDDYNRLWKEKEELKECTEFPKEILDLQAGLSARRRMEEIRAILEGYLRAALERGKDEGIRHQATRELFGP
ncbi:hypothetical protein NKR23_g5539 [Pleurostoma richardsiae]|uniref:Uncharacterized protein n=1 Tax=Pleurostoma richardsiae TaxID=41990 RepID=A0AA38RYZ9_9PEZI|nr:hypothetical protein NKR23_g5539 [Pleurostoma richardsiae]